MTPDMLELYVETQTRTNCNGLFSRQIRLAKSQLRERQKRKVKGHSLTSNVSRESTCFPLHKIEFILHNVGMKSGLWFVHYNVHIVSGVHQTLLSFIPNTLNGLFIYA